MLSRRWLINYFLIVMIILATYIGNKYNVQTGYQEDLSITSLLPAQVTTMSVQTADGNYDLQRDNNRWYLVNPVTWPANNINIERILSITETQTDSRLPASELDLNEVGLQFPQAILRLNTTNILFGSTNNIGARRYVMINDEVFLLPDAHLAFLTAGLPGLADRRLLPSAITLTSLALPARTLDRQALGNWIDSNEEGLSPDQLNSLVGNWQNLQATRVQMMDTNLSPRNKIVARSDQDQTFEFYLLSIDPEIIIANPSLGLQYHFNANQYYELLDTAPDN